MLIRSRDLDCTLVFLSAMPRSATVAIIYALRLSTITSSVNGRTFSEVNDSDLESMDLVYVLT